VRDTIEKSISGKIRDHGLELKAEYFQMVPEVREKFFTIAKKYWRGSINSGFHIKHERE
jgi:hypothetical protein